MINFFSFLIEEFISHSTRSDFFLNYIFQREVEFFPKTVGRVTLPLHSPAAPGACRSCLDHSLTLIIACSPLAVQSTALRGCAAILVCCNSQGLHRAFELRSHVAMQFAAHAFSGAEPALGRDPRSGKPSAALDCFMAKKNRVVENGGADLKVAEP
jgi:hypothetical protein